jgi:superfamily II DNA or RNA helicase
VAPIRVLVYQVYQGPNVAAYKNKATKDKFGIWRNPLRNNIVVRATKEQITELGDPQILIMVQTIEHAFVLQQMLPDFAVAHGSTEDERIEQLRANYGMADWQKPCTKEERAALKERFSSGELRRAIATTIWAKGVDFRGLDVLVRADGLASAIQSTQVPGRLSRLGHDGKKLEGRLVDFNDKFSRDLQYRSQERISMYRHHGWVLEGRL